MKTAVTMHLRQTAVEVAEKTAVVHRELGLVGLAVRACHRLAAPLVYPL